MTNPEIIDSDQAVTFVSRVTTGDTKERAAQLDLLARPWGDDEDLAARAGAWARVACFAEGHTRMFVSEARRVGATWQEIGTALGVTRQAAQQRYGGADLHAATAHDASR